MSSEEARVLARLAQRYPQHREPLLELIELVLSEGEPEAKRNDGSIDLVSFPVDITATRRRNSYHGKLYQDKTVQVNGKTYASPSGAGSDLLNYAVNGWSWWQYRDPKTSRSRPINDLRRRGLL